MSKLGRVTKVKVLFLALVFVFNFDLYKISAAILEKGLLQAHTNFDLNFQLMNSSDYYLNKQLVQYVSSCLEMRDNV